MANSCNGSIDGDADGSADLSQHSQASEGDVALSSGCPLLFEGILRPYQVDGLLWLNVSICITGFRWRAMGVQAGRYMAFCCPLKAKDCH